MSEYYRWMILLHAMLAILMASVAWYYLADVEGILAKAFFLVHLACGVMFVRIAFGYAVLARRKATR